MAILQQQRVAAAPVVKKADDTKGKVRGYSDPKRTGRRPSNHPVLAAADSLEDYDTHAVAGSAPASSATSEREDRACTKAAWAAADEGGTSRDVRSLSDGLPLSDGLRS